MIRTRWIVVVTSLCLAGVYVANAHDAATLESEKPTLVINLTSGPEDLHAVVMGLHFAQHGLDDGREVTVFFNVEAPPLARKDLEDAVRLREMSPVRAMIADLLDHGAKMVVCPLCAEITGVEADDLAPGIDMIEDRKQIFDDLHENSIVFTY